MKQTFVSDILQIPDHIDEEDNDEARSKKASVNKNANNTQRTNQIDSNTEEDEEEDDEEEEDDWENMYNDTGDCLDPKIMQELTASVGKCKIELPKMDYSVKNISIPFVVLFIGEKFQIKIWSLFSFAGISYQTIHFE